MLSGYVTFYEGHHEVMAKKEIEMCIFGEEPLIKKIGRASCYALQIVCALHTMYLTVLTDKV